MFMILACIGTSNDTNTSMEQDKYINEIVKLTLNERQSSVLPSPGHCSGPTTTTTTTTAASALNLINASQGCMISLMNDSSHINTNTNHHNPASTNTASSKTGGVLKPSPPVFSSSSSYSAATPLTNRRSVFASKIERAVQTFKQNYNQHSTVASNNLAATAAPVTASSTNQSFLISHPCSYGNGLACLLSIRPPPP